MERKLTDAAAKKAKPKAKDYKLPDGGNLYLLIRPNGTKLWRYKFRLGGKEGKFAIGAYPEVTLAQAREIHTTSRGLVKKGIAPMLQRKLDMQKVATDTSNTFKAVASDWIAKHWSWWAAYDLRQVQRSMDG